MCACDIATPPARTAPGAHNKQRRDKADGCGVQGQQNCVLAEKGHVPLPPSNLPAIQNARDLTIERGRFTFLPCLAEFRDL